jgi:iron(III) transport system permease protein
MKYLFALIVAGASLWVALPLFFLVTSFWPGAPSDAKAWEHFIQVSLGSVLIHNAYLSITAVFGTLILGTLSAWWIARYEFPGRKILRFALFFPLAIPTYVYAYAAKSAGWTNPWIALPSVFALAFFPYVYLLTRQAFENQGRRLEETGRTLGLNSWQVFWKLRLPLARPWIVGGALLVLMESLADFGAVAVYNFPAFTTAIYSSWFAMFSLETAARIAVLLTILVLVIQGIENRTRQRQKQFQIGKAESLENLRETPSKLRAWGISGTLWALVLLAFGLPIWQIMRLLPDIEDASWQSLWKMDGYIGMSFLFAIGATLLVILLALAQNWWLRRFKKFPWMQTLFRLSHLGYAVPGSVLAAAIYWTMTRTETQILDGIESLGGPVLPLIFTGTPLIVWMGLTMRFLGVGYHPIHSRMQSLKPQLEESARTLGLNGPRILFHVFWPLLRPGLGVAAVLVFVESLKELPVVLLTRPAGFETLSIRIFEWTSEGQWAQAALPSLILVAISLPALFLLDREPHK